MTSRNDFRARVFISCGQAKDTDEPAIADAIARKLTGLGFDFYIAVQEQSLSGLRENIFRKLRESEYFLFVDFKREQLKTQGAAFCRGSLFSHQELAIASFLEMEVLAFQESGVKPLDGVLGILQANAIPFNDRSKLTELVAGKVQERIKSNAWDPRWKNVLTLEREPTQFSDAGCPRFRFLKPGSSSLLFFPNSLPSATKLEIIPSRSPNPSSQTPSP